MRRAVRERGGMQCVNHALAHLLRGTARERQRQNAFRRIDRCEQPQIALGEQSGFAAAGRSLDQHGTARGDGLLARGTVRR